MDKDAHEINKNSSTDNIIDWVKNLMLIEYAEVIKVFDVNTVKVQLLVKHDFAPKTFTVRLLHIGASALHESVTMPQEHDQVLLLFFRSYDDLMFQDPAARAAASDVEDATIVTDSADRYNEFSGVGILARTARGNVPTTLAQYTDPTNGPTIDFQTNATLMAAFKKAVALVFDTQAGAVGSTPSPESVNVIFGKQSPLNIEQRGGAVVEAAKDATTELLFGDNATLDITLGDGALVTLESEDGLTAHFVKAMTITCDKEITLNGSGITIDAKDGKVSIKNTTATVPGDLKTALDSTLTDCSSLVTALVTFATGLSAGSLVAQAAALVTALGLLGFTADKTKVDAVLK
jgi:hypothetical protein